MLFRSRVESKVRDIFGRRLRPRLSRLGARERRRARHRYAPLDGGGELTTNEAGGGGEGVGETAVACRHGGVGLVGRGSGEGATVGGRGRSSASCGGEGSLR